MAREPSTTLETIPSGLKARGRIYIYIYISVYIYTEIYIYIYILPRALSPEGIVSNVVDGSLAILTLVLNTLKRAQEGYSKLPTITRMDFEPIFRLCFFCVVL